MARQTRQQRRERRQGQVAPTGGRRTPSRALANDGPPTAPPPGAEVERTEGGFGPFRFVREAVGELKKVEWPGQQQLIQGTVVVLVACLVVGLYLYGNDKLWKPIYQHLIK